MQNIKMLSVVLLCLLIPLIIIKGKDKSSVITMETEKINKRSGSLIKVKPEYEERYIILHRHTFPGVLDRIRKSNIRNYSIFLLNGVLFSYYEYIGNDFVQDMKDIADPTTKDWWKLTDPMQEPLPTRKEGEWWAEMEPLFSLGDILSPSSKAQRFGQTADVIPGKEKDLIELCKNFPADLEKETYEHNFQNCNLYYKDGKIYYYFEYTGNDINKSFVELTNGENFKSFDSEMNKFLVAKGNGYWELMKEVFHTD